MSFLLSRIFTFINVNKSLFSENCFIGIYFNDIFYMYINCNNMALHQSKHIIKIKTQPTINTSLHDNTLKTSQFCTLHQQGDQRQGKSGRIREFRIPVFKSGKIYLFGENQGKIREFHHETVWRLVTLRRCLRNVLLDFVSISMQVCNFDNSFIGVKWHKKWLMAKRWTLFSPTSALERANR